MHIVRKQDLPFIGSSYNFVGADNANVAVSIFLVEAEPGRGAPLHIHEYDEIAIVQEGTSRFLAGEEIRDTQPGDILVIKKHDIRRGSLCGLLAARYGVHHITPRRPAI